MKSIDYLLSPKTFYQDDINNNILYQQHEFKTLQYLVIEQNANLTYFQHILQEVNFYNSSWKIFFKNPKNIKKIKHSVKLRTNYYLNNSIIANYNFIEFQLLNFNLQKKKKFNFLNKWGRFKFLKIKFLIWYYLYYFYSNIYIIDPYFLFKRRKSLDDKLFFLSVSNFFFKKQALSIYFATFIIESFMGFFNIKKKKKISKISQKKSRLFRSIPRTKLWIALSRKKEFFIDFEEKQFSYKSINFKLNQKLIELVKSLNLLDSTFYLNESLLGFNFHLDKKLNLNINSYFIIFLQFLSFNYCSDFLFLFTNILFTSENLNTFLNIKNQIYKHFDSLAPSYCFHEFKFLFRERFINSYGRKNNFWMQKFRFFIGLAYNDYSKNNLLNNNLGLISFLINDNNLQTFIFLKKLSYPTKLRFKKKYYYYSKFNNLISSIKFNKQMLLFLGDQPLSFNSMLHLWYFTFAFGKLKFLESNNVNFFTLSLVTNYSLLFNNFQHLDSISSFLHVNFFNYSSLYNLIFFYKFFFYKFSAKKLQIYFYINNFEYVFFKKFLIFTSQKKSVSFFYFSFRTLTNCSFFQKFQHWRRFVNALKRRFWFIPRIFLEEIIHLSREYIHGDFERVQEYVRSKQLAELWLNKLTDYLKKMWSLKIDPGNIQYSPDFTEEHEFALTLKWGVELEMLKFTWIIIMRRFFGKIGSYRWKDNLIWRKINFLYNLIKPKILLEPREHCFTVRVAIPKILSLKNVYELTRIQLSTVIACYWNVNRLKMYQLSNFHQNFNLMGERKIFSIYKFFFLIFDWYFLIDAYWKYYQKTKIKKKIWIHKMVRKKVYKRFMLSINFFKILFFKKNLYNYFYFSFFKNFKSNMLKSFKSWYFYNMLFILLHKHFKSFLLPASRTLEDYKIYLLEFSRLNIKFTCKFFLFNNKEKCFTEESFYLILLPTIKIFNSKFKYIKNLSFILPKFKELFFLQTSFLKNYFFFWSLDQIIMNFFSEYIYEKFLEFIISIKPKKCFASKNKFCNSKLFYSITSETFSTSFFFFLNSTSLKMSKKKLKNYENWVFLSEFNNFLISTPQINKFKEKLLEFFMLNPLFKSKQKIYQNNNLFSANCYLISVITTLNNNFLSWRFLLQTITSMLYRLVNLTDVDLSTVFFKKLHFDSIWLKHFIKQLELILVNFLAHTVSKLTNTN